MEGQALLMVSLLDYEQIFQKFNSILKVVVHFKGKELPSPEIIENGDLLYRENDNDQGIVVSKELGDLNDNYLSTLINMENLLVAANDAGKNSDLQILDENHQVVVQVPKSAIERTSYNITEKRNDILLNDEKTEDVKLDVKRNVIIAVCKPDLVGKSAWKVAYDSNIVSAKITDNTFMDDIYKKKINVYSKMKLLVDIELKKILDENIGTYLIKTYTITKVHSEIENGSEQASLFSLE